MRPDYCLGYYGFRVYRDGHYVAGYLRDEYPQVSGQIQPQELAELYHRITRYLTAPPAQSPSQLGTRRIPGSSDRYVLEYADNSAIIIAESGADDKRDLKSQYLHKEIEATKQLTEFVRQLMAHYYPRPFPR